MSTKKAKKDQQYDEYWKLTVEYTDIFGAQFNNTLKVIVKYIDDNIDKINYFNKELYQKLCTRSSETTDTILRAFY